MKHETFRAQGSRAVEVEDFHGANDDVPMRDDALPAPYRRGRESRLVKYGKRLRRPLNRWMAHHSLIPTTPILDPADVPGISVLRENWEVIRAEAMALVAERDVIPPLAEISPDHRRIARNSAWKSFFLRGHGYDSPSNRARAPRTSALIDKVPHCIVAFYSVFEPGTDLAPHHGVSKAMLNIHLGLCVPGPKDECGIRINDEDHGWREGEFLVFDETFKHEAWNRAAQPRVILFLQVMRPMRWPGRALAALFLWGIRRTSYVQDARKAIGA